MASWDEYELLKAEIIKNDGHAVERIMSDNDVIDLITANGAEGNLINIAIERADVSVLALLLGVRCSTDGYATAISFDQYARINSVCDVNDTTPLVKAVQLQRRAMVELLLAFGADVNGCTRDAVDLSKDPEILCLLFERDSKFPVDDEKSKAIEDLIHKDNGKLKAAFVARDGVHKSFEGRDSSTLDSINADIKRAIMRGKYYVNSQGHSLLYTALKNEKFRAWADLLDLGMEYATMEEKKWEMYYVKDCERALVDVLVPFDDCHVMKLASKSYNRRGIKHWKGRNHVVLEYFKHMNGSKITKTLMEVVQDLPGFHIAFDFESTSIEKIRSCSSKDDRGITDIDRFKICVAAKENNEFGFPDIVSNIAHELCHLALAVVYKNNGLPYFKDDEDQTKLYEEVMDRVRCSEGCDEIIIKVWKYPITQQRMELIVRVPEIISKYQGSETDGSRRLEEQAEALLNFYEEHVQPDLENYIQSFTTNQMIAGRGLIEFQEQFLQTDGIRVSDRIEKDIMDFIGEHNGLKVLKSSNLKIAMSHLKTSLVKKGKPVPFCVNWSLYRKCREFVTKGLTSGEIDTLVISWDENIPPSFCKFDRCRGDCLGTYFSNFEERIYLLIRSQWRVLMAVRSLEYSWSDLSTETQAIIQERKIKFNGKEVHLKTLFFGHEEGDNAGKFFRSNLDSKDISLFLEGGDILIGRSNSLRDGRGGNMTLKHPANFIPRVLTRKFVNFNEYLLRNFKNDAFCLGNLELSCLRDLGIGERYIKHWDGNTSGSPAQCYVLNPLSGGKKEDSVINEILVHLRSVKRGEKLHYLKHRSGIFAHIRSMDIQKKTDIETSQIEGLASSCTVESLLETSVLKITDPLLIADDPGTGKTTYLHRVAEEIKETHPEKWVSIIDLGSPAQQKHILTVEDTLSYSREEVLDLLFRLVGTVRKDSLERKIFNEFCLRKYKIIIIFDGFDEICPKYKSIVTSFVVALRKVKEDIKLFVSTRLLERFHLEEELGVISYELKPLSEDEQLTFLNVYWNQLLKGSSPSVRQEKIKNSVCNFGKWVEGKRGEDICNVISKMKEMLAYSNEEQKLYRRKLNLEPVARRVLLDWKTVLIGQEKFVSTPLHVQILAALAFEDSFDLKQTMNLGHLYQRFLNLKMKIYFQEKAGGSGNLRSEENNRTVQQLITGTMENFSVNLLHDGVSSNKDFPTSTSISDGEIMKACIVGLMRKKGGEFQFIHRTFAEFFFAKWILRSAQRREVTELWLRSLFVDANYVRVRNFLEDLLYLLSERTVDSVSAGDFLMLEKTNLDHSVVGDASELQNSIYCIVRECSIHTLEYFEESFGKKFVKVITQTFDQKYCSSVLKDIMSDCWYGYTNLWDIKNDINAITFAWYCFSETKEATHHMTLIKRMFDLVKKNKMLIEMKEHLLSNGVRTFFLEPSKYSIDCGGHLMYATEVLGFLLENKDIFGDILRMWISQRTYGRMFYGLKQIFKSIFAYSPRLLLSVVDGLYDNTQLKNILTNEGVVSVAWICISGTYGLKEIDQFWNFIRVGLEKDKTHLKNYLVWKDDNKCNALFHSALNEDPEVIEFIWGLAGELMGDDEKKNWLFDSFGCGVKLSRDPTIAHWSFHKFLVKRVNSGFLSGEYMLRLMKSKDKHGKCYILQGYPYGLFTHVMPINHNIDNRSFVEEMHYVDFFCNLRQWLDYKSSLPMNEELKEEVDVIFEEVRSLDKYGLAKKIKVDESGLLVGVETKWGRGTIHGDRFKFFVVAFYKQVHFCRDIFKEYCLVRFLKFGGKYPGPNILHVVYETLPLLSLEYICSILMESLSRVQFLDLLLQQDEFGRTVFQRGNSDKDIARWNKLKEISSELLRKNALSAIFPSLKCKGFFERGASAREMEESEGELCGGADEGDDEKHLVIVRLLCEVVNARVDDGDEEGGPLSRAINSHWLENIETNGCARIGRVWDMIKESLKGDRKQLQNYLLLKDRNNFNALVVSAYNEEPEVIEFIWKLAVELMDDEELKRWLFDSFGCGVSYKREVTYLSWSFHKFLAKRVDSGFLSGNEILCLLKSKDECGVCYILRGYPFGLFTNVLPINHNIDIKSFLEEMSNVDFFWNLNSWLNYNSNLTLNYELMEEVDRIFEQVRSHDAHGLADQLVVDEGGFLFGAETKWRGKIHEDRFKFFVVAFFKQVHFCRDNFQEYGLVRFLKLRGKSVRRKPNILHKVYECLPSLCLGYILSILIESLSRGQYLDLLLEPNTFGDTVFHKVFNDTEIAAWNKLNNVVGAIIGKYSGSEDPTEKFIGQDLPVSRDALQEILARWKRIWKEIEKECER